MDGTVKENKMELKTVTIPRDYEGLHCEVDGCIVNIRVGLTDVKERSVTSIEIICDEFAGEKQWSVNGGPTGYRNVRVIQRKHLKRRTACKRKPGE